VNPSKICTEVRGAVLLVGLNRVEKRNAVDLDLYRELALALGELDSRADLRCGVLHALGEHFTGGIDLAQWSPVFARGERPELPPGAVDPCGIDETHRLRKPLLIAVQGICYTIGIELLLAADIRVAARNTRFAQIEVKRGIYPVGGATIRMLQEVGWGNAMRYLLTGDEFSAEEALRIGLVQEVVDTGQQLERALAIAETIAQQAPLGVQATLASARTARVQGDLAALAGLMPEFARLMRSEDAKEGLQSFLERRTARFHGR
jgi:enoyl-CoA hydratase/carnithine racemase